MTQTETNAPRAASPRKRHSPAAMVFAGLLVAMSLIIVGMEFRVDATNRDFISYWSTGRLMAAHADPYDPAAILRVENNAGAHFNEPFVMRNPPWALFLVLPLGWCSAPVAGALWTFAIIGAGLTSVWLLWPRTKGNVPLVVWCFAPILMCVAAGQTGTLLLLGVSLFLYCERRGWPFAAGLALLLPAMKPHLFLLFWPVLLLDCWQRRRFRVLGGVATGLAGALIFAWCVDPHVWTHYLRMMHGQHADDQYLPNISCWLRSIHPDTRWVQEIPTVIGLALVLWQRARASRWTWHREGALLFAGSILTAPYSWPTDQALFLPSVLADYRRASKAAIAILAIVSVVEFVEATRVQNLSSHAYIWTAPAWMLWCGYVYWRAGPSVPEELPGVIPLPAD